MRSFVCAACAALVCTAGTSSVAQASPPAGSSQPSSRPAVIVNVGPAIDKAMRYLAGMQADDGGWPGPDKASDPAITALVAKAFIQHPDFGPHVAIVQKAMRFVLTFRQPDGGIYNPQIGYANYTTSIVLTTLADLRDPSLKSAIEAAQGFLKDGQWAEGKKDDKDHPITTTHPWYGGAGYGSPSQKRPDLSNTQMMIEALSESGLPPSDPVYQKAIAFIGRCQMSGETNDQPFARGADDGGFIYSPANNGESKAGTVSVHGKTRLRSYGSMTYAGFKSLLYAQVDRRDVRVRQAWDWIRQHYTLESNPNMPDEQSNDGLYYYYHTFAKALDAWGEPAVVDVRQVRHDWRQDLCEQLLHRQRPDGSWVNPADRWYEGHPCLVTAYAVLALQIAAPSEPRP